MPSVFALLLLLFLLAWIFSAGGVLALNEMNADVAHHLALVEALVVDRGRARGAANGQLAEMAVYPALSHWTTAGLARLTGRSPVEAITVLATFWCLVIAAAVAWRGAVALRPNRNRPLLRGGAALALGIVFFGLMRIGLGAFGHVLWNYFYAQAAATGLAYLFLAILQLDVWRGRAWPTLLLIAFATALLLSTHALPALWFAGLAFFYFLDDGWSWGEIGRHTAVYAVVIGGVTAVHPATRAMLLISQNDGVYALAARPFANNFLVGITAAAVTLLAAGFVIIFGRRRNLAAFRFTGPFIAIALLMGANWLALLLFDASSWYSVMKYLPILSLELPLALIFLLFNTLPQSNQSNNQINRINRIIDPIVSRISYFVLIFLFFAVQIPFNAWRFDQTPVIEARHALLAERYERSDRPRVYPAGYGRGEDYYLAIGVLAIPRDEETMGWFERLDD